MFLHDHPIVESNILSSWAQLPPSSQTLADLSSCFQILLNCYTGTQQTCVKKTGCPLNGCKMGVGLEKRERVMRYLMIRFLQKLILCAFGINIWALRTCEVHKSQGWQFFLNRIRPLCLSQHLTCKSVGVDVIYQTTPQRVRNQNTTSFVAVI